MFEYMAVCMCVSEVALITQCVALSWVVFVHSVMDFGFVEYTGLFSRPVMSCDAGKFSLAAAAPFFSSPPYLLEAQNQTSKRNEVSGLNAINHS